MPWKSVPLAELYAHWPQGTSRTRTRAHATKDRSITGNAMGFTEHMVRSLPAFYVKKGWRHLYTG